MNMDSKPQDQAERDVLAQLAAELKCAAARMNRKEWRTLLATALASAVKETFRSKYEGGKRIGRLGQLGWRKIRRDGVVITGRELGYAAKEAVASLPLRAKEAFSQLFRLSLAELRDEVVPFIFGLVAFLGASGGLNLEGGLPDADLAVGIGVHRNIFTHSVLLGFTTEATYRFGVEMLSGLYGKLPAEHHPVWDTIHRLIKRGGDCAITGLWLAICFHLVKDAGLFSHATKPYTGLPGEHSMAFHQGLFAANGAASGVMGAAQAASGKPDPH